MDRGDDLLEATRFSPKLSQPSENPSELFENARILHGEGLVQEAKRTLHMVIARVPDHRGARELLETIRSTELQQLLHAEGASVPARPGGPTQPPQASWSGVNVDEVLAKLDTDLALGLKRLPSTADYAEFVGEVERAQVGCSAQDRIDLGVGFFTIELFEIAIAQWDRAARNPECRDNPQRRTELSALRALAYLLLDKPFEAQNLLDGILVDQESDPAQKVEIFYLMGRVRQAQGDAQDAARWYRTVFELDPLYRDVGDRVAL